MLQNGKQVLNNNEVETLPAVGTEIICLGVMVRVRVGVGVRVRV